MTIAPKLPAPVVNLWTHLQETPAANDNMVRPQLRLVEPIPVESPSAFSRFLGIAGHACTFIGLALSVSQDSEPHHHLRPKPAQPLRFPIGIDRFGKTIQQVFSEFQEMAKIMQQILSIEMQLWEQTRLGNRTAIDQLQAQLNSLHEQASFIATVHPIIGGGLRIVASAGSSSMGPATADIDPHERMDDLDELLERQGAFPDPEVLYQKLTALAAQLETLPIQHDANWIRTTTLAQRAALITGDVTFITLARQYTHHFSGEMKPLIERSTDRVMNRIQEIKFPELLMTHMRYAIEHGDEVLADEAANAVLAYAIALRRRVVGYWSRPYQLDIAIAFQIRRFAEATRQLSTSPEQRQLIHDIMSLLGHAAERVTLVEEGTSWIDLLEQMQQAQIPHNLADITHNLRSRWQLTADITFEGFDNVTLANDVDCQQLAIILRNLVNNAVQHKGPLRPRAHIHIKLTYSAKHQALVIKVTDRGAGMSQDVAAMLLNGAPVHDGAPVNHNNPNEFHGFGWQRIRTACAALGITPEIESQVGHGTTVKLHLPKGLLQFPDPDAARNRLRADDHLQTSPDAWQDITTILRYSPGQQQRLYALQRAQQLPHDTEAQRQQIRPLILMGFKDTSTEVVMAAWKLLKTSGAMQPDEITDDMFHYQIMSGPALDYTKAVLTQNDWQLFDQVIGRDPQTQECNNLRINAGRPIALGNIRPMHGPYRYNTDLFTQEIERLRQLRRSNVGPDLFLTSAIEDFRTDVLATPMDVDPRPGLHVLRLGAGEPALLLDGHHRIDLLRTAAAAQIFPEEWLQNLPNVTSAYTGNLPLPLVRRVLTFGYQFTWDNFPTP
ncbi:MAG: hypothetical protein COV45_00570 [Deltaproteobacteria bacterium CG11_big_fil_rev_8_21_14_0_20_47_16]|nr:MAG: hypothetical protein COV45_00570 [Deltaproteobacteria bacterium CG11_big_fil_rev_8_21_14_0_20_47_16]